MTSTDSKPIGLSTRHEQAELLAQFQHRLLALEVDFKERSRGDTAPRRLRKRIRKLRLLQTQVKNLRLQHTPPKTAQGLATDMGLPALSALGPEETAVCEAYLRHRENELRHVDRMLTRLTRWVATATSGRNNVFSAFWHLLSLRKIIGFIQKRTAIVTEEALWIDENSERMLSCMGIQIDSQTKPTMESLSNIYEQIDRNITRVAVLRAKVKSVEGDVQRKQAWLNGQELSLKHYQPHFQTPQPTSIWQLSQKHQRFMGQSRLRTRKETIERFWEEILAPSDPYAGMTKARQRALTTARKGKR